MIADANVVAIRQAYIPAGKDAALVELRRSFVHVSEQAAPGVLAKVQWLPVAFPAAFSVQGELVVDNRRLAMRR